MKSGLVCKTDSVKHTSQSADKIGQISDILRTENQLFKVKYLEYNYCCFQIIMINLDLVVEQE